MGLLSRSLGIQALSMEDPSQPLLPQSALFESLGLGRSDAGNLVNEKQAMRITTVFACINIIQQDLGSLPFSVFQDMGDGSVQESKNLKVCKLIKNPHEVMSPSVFWGGVIARAVGWGNSYTVIERDISARPIGFIPLASEKTSLVKVKGEYLYATTQTDSGEVAYVDPANILHVPGLVMDGPVGLSPIQTCKNAFGLTLAAEKFGAQFFGNGARATGVLTHPAHLDAEAYENLKKSLREMANGENALRPVILEEDMKWSQVSIPPNDAQFIDTRKFQRSEVAALFRVALHLLQDLERATNNNIEHQSLDHVRYCLKPWAVRVEQEVTRKLLSGSFFAEFDMKDIMRGDFASQTAGFQVLRNIGVLSTNDILLAMRKNPISEEDGGDVRTVQGAMIPLQALTTDQWQNAQGGQEEAQQSGADVARENPPATAMHPGAIQAYRRLFRDAIGRSITRKNDPEFVARAMQPILASMVEAHNAVRFGKAELNEQDQEFVGQYAHETAVSAAEWTKENASETATRVTEEAYRRIGDRQ